MLSKKEEWVYGVMTSDEISILQGGIPFRIGKGEEEETVKCGMGYDTNGIFDPELYKLHKKHQYDYSAWY